MRTITIIHSSHISIVLLVEENWTETAMKKWYNSCYPKQHCSHDSQHIHETSTSIVLVYGWFAWVSASLSFEVYNHHAWTILWLLYCVPSLLFFTFYISWILRHPKSVVMCHVSCWCWCWCWCWTIWTVYQLICMLSPVIGVIKWDSPPPVVFKAKPPWFY